MCYIRRFHYVAHTTVLLRLFTCSIAAGGVAAGSAIQLGDADDHLAHRAASGLRGKDFPSGQLPQHDAVARTRAPTVGSGVGASAGNACHFTNRVQRNAREGGCPAFAGLAPAL